MLRQQRRSLELLLGITEKPDDDLERLDGLRTEDSCEWLTDRSSFQQWRDGDGEKVIWITAKPGTGKS